VFAMLAVLDPSQKLGLEGGNALHYDGHARRCSLMQILDEM